MRHHNTRPRMRRNHAPHAAVENARINPTAGETSSSRSAGRVPTQYSIANRMATNTIALPRSCWAQTRRKGTRTMTPGVMSSRMVAGGERRSAAQRATINTTASLASSAGWSRNGPPRTIHDFVPAAVPARVPRESIARQRVASRRVRERGQDLHFVRRGVRREHDLVLRRFGGIGAEIAGDDPGHERRHVRTLVRELDDGADHDLRLVRRREADEPSVL